MRERGAVQGARAHEEIPIGLYFDEATLGTRFDISVEGFGTEAKVFLVQAMIQPVLVGATTRLGDAGLTVVLDDVF